MAVELHGGNHRDVLLLLLGPSTVIPSNDSWLSSHYQNLGQYCWRVRCVIQNINNKHRSPWRKNNHHRIHGCYWMPCFQPDVVFFHKRQDHKTATHQPTEASSKNERDDQHVEFLLECGTMTSRKLVQTQAGLPTHSFSRKADRISNFRPVFCWSALKINLLMCKENHNM